MLHAGLSFASSQPPTTRTFNTKLGTKHQVAELTQRRHGNLPFLGHALHERPGTCSHFGHPHDVAYVWDNLSRMRLFTASDDVC